MNEHSTGDRVALLFRQASTTAETYMMRAEDAIDEQFGKGYARANPGLVGAFMQTAALDFAATFQADFLGLLVDKFETIGHALLSIPSAEELAEAVGRGGGREEEQ